MSFQRPTKKIQAYQYMVYLLGLSCAMISYANTALTDKALMLASQQHHQQYPFVYEEQTLILIDKQGKKNVRKLRRYSRINEDKSIQYLLVFDHPPEIKGVALIATRQANGDTQHSLFLPAFSQRLIPIHYRDPSNHFLGTDFSIADLIPEMTDQFRYQQQADEEINYIPHYVLQVYPRNNPKQLSHTHYLRQDNLFITQTVYVDAQQQPIKKRTFHDLKQLDRHMWRANMLLMTDYQQQHQSLLKINRRVLSYDYVPSKVFTLTWLIQNADNQPAIAAKKPNHHSPQPVLKDQ